MITGSFRKVLALALALAIPATEAIAQGNPPGGPPTREQLEERFDVMPLRDGVALRPRRADAGVRSIEVASGVVAIDGVPVTGAELRERLGADAELVLQLSYLSDAARRRLVAAEDVAAPSQSAPPPPAAPSRPQPPSPTAAPPADTVPPAPDRPRVPRRVRDVVRFGGNVAIDEDELVTGDVVAIGGSARVDGEVRGNVVAIGGSVRLGPRARVAEDVTVVGGRLQADPAAQVEGRVNEISPAAFGGDWRWAAGPGPWWGWRFGSAVALMATLVRVAVLALLAALVVLLAREQVERIGLRAWAEPLKAGGIGFLATLLLVPVLVVTVIVLVITIIGIPLLALIPFALLALAIIALVGFTAVAQNVGRFVSRRLGWTVTDPYATTLLGLTTIELPLLLARLIAIGGGLLFPMTFGLSLVWWLAFCAAWMIGLGAVALTRYSPRAAGAA